MERKSGYYWVKIDTTDDELKFYGDHWRAALWYCNNGDGSDLMWRIAGEDKRFYDHDFSVINETRIPAPDEKISIVETSIKWYADSLNPDQRDDFLKRNTPIDYITEYKSPEVQAKFIEFMGIKGNKFFGEFVKK